MPNKNNGFVWKAIGIGVGVVATALFVGVLNNKDNSFGLSGIKKKDVFNKSVDLDKKDLNASKSYITRSINKIISNHIVKGFKIGKSGQPYDRAGQYDDYNNAYLFAKSEDSEIISDLESYYNDYYYEHKKNDNINKGSAGKMVTKDGYYYLYIAIR